MSVQKAIFPGLIIGIVCLLVMTRILTGGAARVVTNTLPEVGKKLQTQAAECTISPAYPESIRQWCGEIERYARENGLDPNLISALMLQESAGQPDAYSKSGAVGLMQVMPRDGKAASFMCKNGPCFADRPSMQELFDPQYNIAFGTRMLAELIHKRGNLREALKAYGPMDVGYYYADLVIGIMNNHQ
ncbi:MAG: lytic transglycosylase domain-containing protein [Chloroflexi bacterium]|nr:MAG: lytic transglycosylase domain-containing protein [Chloroflexota bacterium]